MSDPCWQGEVGKGAFQELDQVTAVQRFTKYAGQAKSIADIPAVIKAAAAATVSGRPGAAYVDIPSNVLMASSSSPAVSESAQSCAPCLAMGMGGACRSALQVALTDFT